MMKYPIYTVSGLLVSLSLLSACSAVPQYEGHNNPALIVRTYHEPRIIKEPHINSYHGGVICHRHQGSPRAHCHR